MYVLRFMFHLPIHVLTLGQLGRYVLIPGQTLSTSIDVGRSWSGYDGGHYRRYALGNDQDEDD
jgi:hypothetical protein